MTLCLLRGSGGCCINTYSSHYNCEAHSSPHDRPPRLLLIGFLRAGHVPIFSRTLFISCLIKASVHLECHNPTTWGIICGYCLKDRNLCRGVCWDGSLANYSTGRAFSPRPGNKAVPLPRASCTAAGFHHCVWHQTKIPTDDNKKIWKQMYWATTHCVCVQKYEFSLKLLTPVQRDTELTAGSAATGHFKV